MLDGERKNGDDVHPHMKHIIRFNSSSDHCVAIEWHSNAVADNALSQLRDEKEWGGESLDLKTPSLAKMQAKLILRL